MYDNPPVFMPVTAITLSPRHPTLAQQEASRKNGRTGGRPKALVKAPKKDSIAGKIMAKGVRSLDHRSGSAEEYDQLLACLMEDHQPRTHQGVILVQILAADTMDLRAIIQMRKALMETVPDPTDPRRPPNHEEDLRSAVKAQLFISYLLASGGVLDPTAQVEESVLRDAAGTCWMRAGFDREDLPRLEERAAAGEVGLKEAIDGIRVKLPVYNLKGTEQSEGFLRILKGEEPITPEVMPAWRIFLKDVEASCARRCKRLLEFISRDVWNERLKQHKVVAGNAASIDGLNRLEGVIRQNIESGIRLIQRAEKGR